MPQHSTQSEKKTFGNRAASNASTSEDVSSQVCNYGIKCTKESCNRVHIDNGKVLPATFRDEIKASRDEIKAQKAAAQPKKEHKAHSAATSSAPTTLSQSIELLIQAVDGMGIPHTKVDFDELRDLAKRVDTLKTLFSKN